MLSVLREIGENFKGGILQRNSFKIVYVAPMKALAQEMVSKFGERLKKLNVVVKELTGDMQLTKKEIQETQIIVTTPEKWDVITRKSGESSLTVLTKLLILDEVHLLNDDRGPVIETLVARTLRQVESTQSVIRIVGLSATLPNYKDVADFLNVNLKTGLFYFDASYRPVPLSMKFLGVKEYKNFMLRNEQMNQMCYQETIAAVKKGYQVMVFVHSRNDTSKTAETLIDISVTNSEQKFFMPKDDGGFLGREMRKCKSSKLKTLLGGGFAIHHAGMLRSDRSMVERLFESGDVRVLCCTATLAWGVNLPAHTVIIKGTQLYNSERGSFVDLGILDVMQIFGRAGRPQYDTSGEAILITTHDKLHQYLKLICSQIPIESQFLRNVVDNLNAEIVLGTVANVEDAIRWLSYTYLFIRMRKNPLAYGIDWDELQRDPILESRRRSIILEAANRLDEREMIRFDYRANQRDRNSFLSATSLGRIASHYYIKNETISLFNEKLNSNMKLEQLLHLLSSSSEFENITLREDEVMELENLKKSYCLFPSDVNGKSSKVNILIQSFLSRANIKGFSLICDTQYVIQNAQRISRALFEILMKKGWSLVAARMLTLCKMIERQQWHKQHPLRQLIPFVSESIVKKLESRNLTVERIYDLQPNELNSLLNLTGVASNIYKTLSYIPYLEIQFYAQPITRQIMKLSITLTPNFIWKDSIHGPLQPFWVYVEDPDTGEISHSQSFLLHKEKHKSPHYLVFTVSSFLLFYLDYFILF